MEPGRDAPDHSAIGFLVVTRRPTDPTATIRGAAAVGMPLPDFSRKLTGPLPRVVQSFADVLVLARAAGSLSDLGFGAFGLGGDLVTRQARRRIARSLRFEALALVVIDPNGGEEAVPWSSLSLVQRAVRIEVQVDVETTRTKEISAARSVLSGGLINRRTVETKTTHRRESREAIIVLHRADGEMDVVLSETRLDYRFLGASMQAAGFPNLESTLKLVRAECPALPVDDRVARPGFVAGVPHGSLDPVDLALVMVRETYRLAP